MLSTTLAIARKDLQILRRDPRGLVSLFVMPAMFLVVMTLALSKTWGTPRAGIPNIVQQNVPGWTLFGVFFVAQQLALSLLEEKRSGTFRRLLASPAPRAAILLGKLVPYLLLNLAQVTLMFAAGVFLLPRLGAPALSLGTHPFALLAVSVAASLAATGLGLLLASLANTQEQLGGFGTLVVLTMAALGGVMVPRFAMPASMQRLGLFTPHAWALTAYQDVLVLGHGLVQILPAVGALLAFAVVFFGVALVKFRWE
ncbi:MAG TPA: ABC transporter permease [Thermoanaerobaculia bacterium]|jgi:ABC-2 type transport system permease protein|nr:ABC transporter permease [Thermoanaerobaculia bacterium]